MDDPARLITTKILRPRRRDDLLSRRRLVNFILAQTNRKLVIVSAPAGYGKTSLLIDYTHHTELPVCWYALDERDSDLRVFLEYLVASIRRHFPNLGQQIDAILHSDESHFPDHETIVAAFVNDITEEVAEQFVIILDDYHLIDAESEVHSFLDKLLQYLPDHCHILLASRALPPFTLTRMVARQEVEGLGVEDLRFTAPEIQQLMKQNYDLELLDEQARELAQELDGWIAGVLLTRHTLWKGLFADMIRTQGESKVFEYLANEVFAQQPKNAQTFLLRSAVLDQMSPKICDDLFNTKGSDAILKYLESQNLFIFRLEGPGEWYRYHQLFREFLLTRLKSLEPDQYRALHLEAAQLFTRRNEPSPTIQHFLAAAAYQEAAEVIESVADDTFNTGRWTTLARWIDALPRDIILRQPRLMIYRAKVWIQTSQLTEAIDELDEASKLFQAIESPVHHAEALTYKSVALRIQGHYEDAIQQCEQALNLLGHDDSPVAAQAYRNIGIAYGIQGNLSDSAEQLSQALRLYEAQGEAYHIASLHHDLATTYLRAGDLTQASIHYRQALHHWRETNNVARVSETLNGLGCALYYQGAHEAARELLEEALSEARKAQYGRVEAAVLAGLGDVAHAQEHFEEALSHYEQALRVGENIGEETIMVYVLNAMGRTLCTLGQYNRAWICATEALSLADQRGSVYDVGLSRDALGILLHSRAELDRAIQHFTEARSHFNACGAKRELAIADLHLALALYENASPQNALGYLNQALQLADELGYDYFLIAEGKRSIELYKDAIARRNSNGRLTRILEDLADEKPAGAPKPSNVVVPSEPETEPKLRIRALGQSQVWLNDAQITRRQWDSAITKEMFFYLLAHTEGVRKDKILEVFWPESTYARASSAFHSTNYRLRQALQDPDCILYKNGVYTINPELYYWYDVEEFQTLIKQAENASSEHEKASIYEQAIDLYKGDYLEEFYTDWSYFQREELQRQYFEALMHLADYYRHAGRAEEALPLYEKIVAEDPYREEIHREIMNVYVECGKRAAAVSHYQKFEAFLHSDLNVDPMPETTALYEAILAGRDQTEESPN